jgi:HSP20 family protein
MTLIRPDLTWPATLDEWLRDALWGEDPLRPLRLAGLREDARTALAADLYEDHDAFHALVELPGVSKDAVEVTVENAVLRITATVTETGGGQERRLELGRTLPVPDGVDVSRIGAELKNGLLHVHLPKEEERKPRAIEVR